MTAPLRGRTPTGTAGGDPSQRGRPGRDRAGRGGTAPPTPARGAPCGPCLPDLPRAGALSPGASVSQAVVTHVGPVVGKVFSPTHPGPPQPLRPAPPTCLPSLGSSSERDCGGRWPPCRGRALGQGWEGHLRGGEELPADTSQVPGRLGGPEQDPAASVSSLRAERGPQWNALSPARRRGLCGGLPGLTGMSGAGGGEHRSCGTSRGERAPHHQRFQKLVAPKGQQGAGTRPGETYGGRADPEGPGGTCQTGRGRAATRLGCSRTPGARPLGLGWGRQMAGPASARYLFEMLVVKGNPGRPRLADPGAVIRGLFVGCNRTELVVRACLSPGRVAGPGRGTGRVWGPREGIPNTAHRAGPPGVSAPR